MVKQERGGEKEVTDHNIIQPHVADGRPQPASLNKYSCPPI